MSRPKVLFPVCSLEVPVLQNAEVIAFDPERPVPAPHRDGEVLVVWEMSSAQVRGAIEQLPNLRLVQVLSAGLDRVPEMGIPEGVQVEGGSGLHDQTVAEHALALTLAGIRGLNDLLRAQIGHRWATEWVGPEQLRDLSKLATLHEANVLILGYGHIGRELGKYLSVLGANIRGIARTSRTEGNVVVSTFDALPQLLGSTDVLISILPASDGTTDLIDRTVFRKLPQHAWFVNVGRGTTVVEDDLINALRANQIAGAAIDVAREEPLPVDSPLWDAPNLIISPHSAGGRPRGYAELIERNVAALTQTRGS